MLFEVIAICSAVLTGICIGVVLVMFFYLRQVTNFIIDERKHVAASLVKARQDLEDQVRKFDEITKGASAANNSHATKLIEMQNVIQALDERIALLTGNGGFTTGWMKKGKN